MTHVLNFKDYKPVVELSNDALIAKCSSIGATEPAPGCSDKYSFIPTLDAVNYMRDSGFIPIQASQGKVLTDARQGFQQHMIKFTRPDMDLGDRRLEINLYNSHDRGSSYILSGGLYRLICSNGMVVAAGNNTEFRHRHVGFDADLFIESAKFVAGNLEKVAERVNDWETIELTPDEQNTFALAAHEVVNAGKDHIGTSHNQLLQIRRNADSGSDLWKIFNRIQENVIKGGLFSMSEKGRRSRTRQVTNIKRDKDLNQQLWAQADYIAKFKQAA